MGNRVLVTLVAVALTPFGGLQPQRASKPNWDALQFLQGKWVGEGTSESGQGSGYFTFEPDLLGTVWLRRNHAEYPAANRPPVVHEDLMIVYADADGTTVRAFYTDTEGHVIPYIVTTSAARDTATFLSQPPSGQPTYRLMYVRLAASRMSVVLDMAPPDHPDRFKTIVHGIVRKL